MFSIVSFQLVVLPFWLCCFFLVLFFPSVLSFSNDCLQDSVSWLPLLCQSCLWAFSPGKMADLGICSCLLLVFCSKICDFFWFWLCSMSFCVFCFFFLLLIVLWILLLFPVFAYYFTLLASLAFRCVASHAVYFLQMFVPLLLFLCLFLVFLLHILLFSLLIALDLLSFFASFSYCSLFILVGCFLLLLFCANCSLFFLLLMLLLFIVLWFFLVWVHFASLCLCAFFGCFVGLPQQQQYNNQKSRKKPLSTTPEFEQKRCKNRRFCVFLGGGWGAEMSKTEDMKSFFLSSSENTAK